MRVDAHPGDPEPCEHCASPSIVEVLRARIALLEVEVRRERRLRERQLADAQSTLDQIDITMQQLLLARDAAVRATQ